MGVIEVNEYARQGMPDDEAIRRALDAAAAGDTVRIPRFNRVTGKCEWRIGKALVIPTGITLLLDNCRLVMETGTYDNMIRNAEGAFGITVMGEGNAVLSGGEWNYLSNNMSGRYGLPDVSVNALIKFSRVKNAEVKNLRFEMARWASVMIDHAEGILLRNLWFEMIPHVKDLYGVMIGCGCRNIDISNLTGRTGDDSVYIFADPGRYAEKENAEISGIRIRNLVTDPKFASTVHIRAAGGLRIRDVEMDGSVDSSDFFDKKRICANVHIGTTEAEMCPSKPADISGITLKNAFSSAVSAVLMNGSFSDSGFENIFTFGDNITIVNSTAGCATAENVRFRRLYYGKGSKPNNSTSFISRYAVGSRAVQLEKVEGNGGSSVKGVCKARRHRGGERCGKTAGSPASREKRRYLQSDRRQGYDRRQDREDPRGHGA